MSTIAAALRATLGRALLPPTCCLCGAPGQAPDLDLCSVCVDLLPRAVLTAGTVLTTGTLPMAGTVPVAGTVPMVGTAPMAAPGSVRVQVPFDYAWPVDQLVRALKFRGERVYARVLGTLLAQHVRGSEQPLPQLMVPIPLHAERYRHRGFNQAHELARHAAAHLGIRVDARCLRRRVNTSEQSGLSLARRRRNVRGAFEMVRPIAARHIALIDDVLTTGSTALAAVQALRDAGITDIEVWAIARVERG